MRTVPRLCELYPGNCPTTEEKARKNLRQGRRKVPDGHDLNAEMSSQAKVLTGGGDLREAQVSAPLSVSHSCA